MISPLRNRFIDTHIYCSISVASKSSSAQRYNKVQITTVLRTLAEFNSQYPTARTLGQIAHGRIHTAPQLRHGWQNPTANCELTGGRFTIEHFIHRNYLAKLLVALKFNESCGGIISCTKAVALLEVYVGPYAISRFKICGYANLSST